MFQPTRKQPVRRRPRLQFTPLVLRVLARSRVLAREMGEERYARTVHLEIALREASRALRSDHPPKETARP